MKRNGLIILVTVIAVQLFGTSQILAEQHKDRYVVTFKPGTASHAQQAIANAGGEPLLTLPNHSAVAIMMPERALEGLSRNPNIVSIELDQKRYPSAESTPYGIPMVQADLVSDGQASNRSICIIDSGYDINHPDLSANNVTGSFDSGTGDWFYDDNGHGTHVAGTIAAISNGDGVVGVLPNQSINLHIVKVFTAAGWAYSSSLIAAVDECVANGANVINMSLGGNRPLGIERKAFNSFSNQGVLAVAAAGNAGSSAKSYPASYPSVLSVAAIDDGKNIASFSQFNDEVELSGPGVGVLSTVPVGAGRKSTLIYNNQPIASAGMDGTPLGSVAGSLANCDLGESVCQDTAGKVCLIQRGIISFSDKVLSCEAGGGIGTIIYNNEPGVLFGTLGGVSTNIPSIGVSDTAGQTLLAGGEVSFSIVATDYAYFDGTSMATPHVAAVAALVWSYDTSCTNYDIRNLLAATAEDLGDAGRDVYYGHGLVRAEAAVNELQASGCSGSDDSGETGGNGNGNGNKGKKPK